MNNRYSQPILCTVVLTESDVRLIVACIYEAQHSALAFAERRTDEALTRIVAGFHRSLLRK